MQSDFYLLALPLVAGYAADCIFGDPRGIPHPVVAFGKAIAGLERKLNQGNNRRGKGCAVAVGLLVLTGCFFGGLGWLAARGGSWCYGTVAALFVFYGLANRSLIREGGEVVRVLEEEGLDAGRRRLTWIVGRETTHLSSKQVYTAVLETMAENLSDGVVAPLFYYALGGFPAMMVYKMGNTLDSMIGYRNDRYREFGCCAARIDDILNYIPARLTACLMIAVGYRRGLIRFVWKNGRRHASPNAGYPEAAMAGILNCRFGGTHIYHGVTVRKPHIGDNDRAVNRRDYCRAVRVNQGVTFLTVAGVVLLVYFV